MANPDINQASGSETRIRRLWTRISPFAPMSAGIVLAILAIFLTLRDGNRLAMLSDIFAMSLYAASLALNGSLIYMKVDSKRLDSRIDVINSVIIEMLGLMKKERETSVDLTGELNTKLKILEERLMALEVPEKKSKKKKT